MADILDSCVTVLKDVGAVTAKRLSLLNIYTINDLILYFPREYADRSKLSFIEELVVGQTATIKCSAAALPQKLWHNGKNNVKVLFTDDGRDSGRIEVVWYNMPFMANVIRIGVSYFLTGKAVLKKGILCMENPEYEDASEGSLSANRIVPVYPLTKGISQKSLRKIIAQGLTVAREHINDFLPQSFIVQYRLCHRSFAIKNIHFPGNDKDYFLARRRLVFEELFIMQLALLSVKGELKIKAMHKFEKLDYGYVLDKLPYKLTNAQAVVLDDAIKDISSGFLMNRLIQGDVGSGKTAVAMILCYLCAKNGLQAALMAPTEALARQHYGSFLQLFGDDISYRLLTANVKAAEKSKIKQELLEGKIDVLIGTHALIQDNVVFKNLALAITDEQHRFGVRQRMKLASKGIPHTLVMTATPIPRSLAMVLYGDMDISIINEMPPGRQKIDTFCVTTSYHARIFTFIKEEVKKGHQVYIICPLIEESEHPEYQDIASVSSFTEKLKGQVFFGERVAMLHGKMKPHEKNDIMQSFSDGNIDILIATTVVEVGINVPNATVMLIENAERFGLSALHQLRGRVGRSDKKSFCVLITDSKNKITKQRMAAMVSTNDGFELSELDLKLRGPGEFFGTMQHGIPPLSFANLYKDINILQQASEACMYILNNNMLDLKMYEPLKQKLKVIFDSMENIGL